VSQTPSGGIDVLQRETGGTAVARNAAQQSAFISGKARFHLVGNDAFAFARALIPVLRC